MRPPSTCSPTLARDADEPDRRRVRAVEVLVAADRDDPALLDVLGRILADNAASIDLRGGLLEALQRSDAPTVADRVLAAYPTMEPTLKPRAVELLTARPAWGKALLAAVADGTVPKETINVNQLRKLQNSGDEAIVAAVRDTWGTIREGRDPRRDLVIGQMRELPAEVPRRPLRRPAGLRQGLRPVSQDLRRGAGGRPRPDRRRP